MKVTSSYAVHVQDHRQSLKATVSLYRAAVAFMIDVVDKEWDTLPPICAAGGKLGQHALEHMIHKTKGFPKPKYNFGEKFYKFPILPGSSQKEDSGFLGLKSPNSLKDIEPTTKEVLRNV